MADGSVAIRLADVRVDEAVRRGVRVRRFRHASEPAAESEAATSRMRGEDRSVAVVGLGDCGLRTALAFAAAGCQLLGVDLSRERLAQIESGRVDLTAADHQRLRLALVNPLFTLTPESRGIADADVVVICVPTCVDDHMLPDMGLLATACADVVRLARAGQMILLTSTTYAGTTTDLLVRPLESLGFRVGEDINVAFSPERISPSAAPAEQAHLPRIVGGATQACGERAAKMIAAITTSVYPVSSPEAAEMARLFEATYRAVNIALVNEFSSACNEIGIEPMEVIDTAATNPSGFTRFRPGPGVGGHSLPNDPHYLTWQMRRYRMRMPVVESAMNAIAERPMQVVARIQALLSDAGVAARGAHVLVVGVAYKPNIGDVRESPAIEIVGRLMDLGIAVTIADRRVRAMPLPDGRVVEVERLEDVAVADFDLVLVHTLHDNEDLTPLADSQLLLDATYQLDPQPQRVVL